VKLDDVNNTIQLPSCRRALIPLFSYTNVNPPSTTTQMMVQEEHKSRKIVISKRSRECHHHRRHKIFSTTTPSLISWMTVSLMVLLCSTTTQVHTFPCNSFTTVVLTRIPHSSKPAVPRSTVVEAAGQRFGGEGIGGGGGFAASSSSSSSSSSSKKSKTNNKKKPEKQFTKDALLKQIERKYGGSTPQDIARGTQVMIDQAIQELPHHLQLALQLHRQDIDWQRRTLSMDVLTLSKLPPQLIEQAQRVEEALQGLLQEHSLTKQDLQSIVQQITWNASADAKAVKSLTGTMPQDIQNRVQRACEYAAKTTSDSGNEKGMVLDVGCGYGVLVPYLKQAGLAASQIHGMDLSPEMIRNARSFYPDVTLQVANFLTVSDSNNKYQAVIFCSSLHDLPDIPHALNKAYDLLESNGRLIIVHPQGASHVAQQHKSNPVLVPRGLPTMAELQEWFCRGDDDDDHEKRMEVTVAPAKSNSQQELREGYLAVLTKL
jgi:2-polyprenyl-3-methyl-5-hydroxy-6-metoxy-1,4-benzoquinol methylase